MQKTIDRTHWSNVTMNPHDEQRKNRKSDLIHSLPHTVRAEGTANMITPQMHTWFQLCPVLPGRRRLAADEHWRNGMWRLQELPGKFIPTDQYHQHRLTMPVYAVFPRTSLQSGVTTGTLCAGWLLQRVNQHGLRLPFLYHINYEVFIRMVK